MAIYIDIAQALLISLVSYAAWRVIRAYVIKSPLARIPGPPKASWWTGNFYQIFNRQGWKFHHDIVAKYGGAVKIHGLFGDEQLYVSDPRALHHIVVKDQYVYEETDSFIALNKLVFGQSLLSTTGAQHRKQRKMLNPVFSIRHMRGMIPIFYPIAHQLRDILTRKVRSGETEINIMAWMSRAALEYIGQGGLGYTFGALDETKVNTYSEAVKMLFPTALELAFLQQLIPYITRAVPLPLRTALARWTPWPAVRRVRDIVQIMDDTSLAIFAKNRAALATGDAAVLRQVGGGKDIMSVLLRANTEADAEDRLPDEELIGQMSTFIFAGHDTTTSALSRTLHQLALYPDVQQKLREEVTAARKEHGDLSYDVLMALPYLDAVGRETLRVFPPVPFLLRTTRKDITLPLLHPITTTDGAVISEIPLKRNTNVIISVLAANTASAVWGPDAKEWKPERWLAPLPESVARAHLPGVYSSIMTFHGGGRACIGFKFAEMEMKLMLSVLLVTFAFAPAREISWNMGFLQSPVVKGARGTTPQLPLRVSLVLDGSDALRIPGEHGLDML